MLILYGVKSAEALSRRFSSSAYPPPPSLRFNSIAHRPSTGWMMIARIYIYISEYFAKKRVVFQVSREEKDRRLETDGGGRRRRRVIDGGEDGVGKVR